MRESHVLCLLAITWLLYRGTEAQNCTFDNDLCGYVQGSINKLSWNRTSRQGVRGPLTENTAKLTGIIKTVKGKTCLETFNYVVKYYRECAPAVVGPWCYTTNGKSDWDICVLGSYLQADMRSGQEGDSARITTPTMAVSQPSCFEFWLFMNGPSISTLNVYTLQSSSPVVTVVGPQGPSWKKRNILLTSSPQVSVTFEAIRGSGQYGDISIDDVSISPGTCIVSGCTFDSEWCGFHPLAGSNFNWTLNLGSTSTAETGPVVDHTTGTLSGGYMYIKADGRKRGDIARIAATVQSTSPLSCATFWFHMYGVDIGTLNVLTAGPDGKSAPMKIWSRSYNLGNQWLLGQADVNTSQPINVIFEGIVGTGSKGDIAVDDFNMINGRCPNSAVCDFNTNFCNWVQPASQSMSWVRSTASTCGSQSSCPTSDRLGGSGNFLTAGPPNANGDVAVLFRSQMNNTINVCFTFWYHMVGKDSGTLAVFVNSTASSQATWSVSGASGKGWRSGQVPVKSSSPYSISVVGTALLGDGIIAVDDFAFLDGDCTIVPDEADPTNTPRTTASPLTTKPPGPAGSWSCNFEKGPCSWYSDTVNTTNNWTWIMASTSKGADTDHTTGLGTGFYMVLQTSTTSRRVARLVSSSMPDTLNSNGRCLRFWYSVFGQHVDQLNMYQRTASGDGDAIWKRRSSQSNSWVEGRVTLNSRTQFQVVFEGITMKGSLGALCIDDVTTSEAPCQSGQDTVYCDFESDSICGYKFSLKDSSYFSWTRGNGKTSSPNTAPSTDHTLQTSYGYFMYMDPSRRSKGDQAVMYSATQPATRTGICLRFWYHMSGRTIGALYVSIMANNKDSVIWSESGDHGNTWMVQEVTIFSKDSYSVNFKAIVGGSTSGDIAIDDISVADRSCSPLGSCTFEEGFCTFVNDATNDTQWIITRYSRLSSGPRVDHTFSTADGFYAAVIADTNYAKSKARLRSADLTGSSKTQCFKFWYHIYGNNIGSLSIYTRLLTGGPEDLVWILNDQQQTSDNGNWLQASIPLDITSNFMVVIESLIQGQSGHIAIDDTEMGQFSCTFSPTKANPGKITTSKPITFFSTLPPTIAPGAYNCDFEKDFCSYTHNSTTRLTRSQAAPLSNSNLPPVDHSKGMGVVTARGPGSLVHTSQNCLAVKTPVNEGNSVVMDRLCGTTQNEVVLSINGSLLFTSYGMCIVAKTSPAAAGTQLVVSSNCGSYTWTLSRTGSLQLSGTQLCVAYVKPNLVLDPKCSSTSDLFIFMPTLGFFLKPESSFFSSPIRLVSPEIVTPNQCFQFWYFMDGFSVKRLNVVAETRNGARTVVWSRISRQGDRWKQAHINLGSMTQFKLVFEIPSSFSYYVPVIDDVTLDSTCSASNTCDFEDVVDPLCGLRQLKTDDFDWRVTTGSTNTSGTGPTTDHTFRTSTGHYIYIEADDVAFANKVAQLETLPFQPTTSEGRCLELWYHMYGSSIGQLNIYVRSKGSTVLGSPFWSKSGNQGQEWFRAQINIKSGSVFTIILEAARGAGVEGDISLDDLYMHSQPCVDILSTCDLERFDLCPWYNSLDDDFDFTPRSGLQASSGSGPAVDNSQKTFLGKYLYFNAAFGFNTQKARILSEQLLVNTKSSLCLRFYYFMTGIAVGTLNIYSRTSPGITNEKLLWTLSGNQNSLWLYGSVPIAMTSNFQVIFEAVRTGASQGSISLDDISFSVQSCGWSPTDANPDQGTTTAASTVATTPGLTSLGCTFETGYCSWKNDTTVSKRWISRKGSTPSYQTGPLKDHTRNDGNGTYVYLDGSTCTTSESAGLISPDLSADSKASGRCLSFWYHMFGPNVQTLSVYKLEAGSKSSPLWTRRGNRGMVWQNAVVNIQSSFKYNVVLTATCNNGLKGDIALDDIDVVDGPCRASTVCDFEDANMCGFDRDSANDYDWARKAGPTPTPDTGPKVDHSYRSSTGFYVYADARLVSSAGKKARLLSPKYPKSDRRCLEFWYHMYGADIDRLNVYIEEPDVSSTKRSQIWSRVGNHGQDWRIARASVPAAGAGNRIAFEVVRGKGLAGDIALDDYQIIDGSCPTPGDCNFEEGLCAWQNMDSDKFDWLLLSGSTHSVYTGPTTDHTTLSPDGQYILIESSDRNPGDIARLISETFTSSGSNGNCFWFWYHMKGAGIGTLSIIIRLQNGTEIVAWTLSGAQGVDWMYGQTGIITDQDYQIILEAARGTSEFGDIALDDVAFGRAWCPSLPPTSGLLTTTTSPAVITTTTKPGFSSPWDCDFQYDFCSWTLSSVGKFNWTRNQGSTASDFTGPKFDHTFMNASGYYAYIETSSPQQPNDTAYLVSDTIPVSGVRCLSFWFHMYGKHINNLQVWLQSSSGKTLLWNKLGEQGNQWRHATVRLSSMSPFQIVFAGVRGISYLGDIAIDDIAVTSGACPSSPECTFEDMTYCMWSNVLGDDFNWTRTNMPTLTSYTGPRVDHTYGTSVGYFMYIETSSPTKVGDRAWLQSIQLEPTTGHCLSFWYHMYGNDIGSLSVFLRSGGARSVALWSLSGNYMDVWRRALVNVVSFSSFNIVIEGVSGGIEGDIALDDILLTPGSCPSAGSCTFEQDECGYINSEFDEFDWLVGSGGTSSSMTGPSTDHTTGTSTGSYVFIETSDPQLLYDRAWYFSDVIPFNDRGKCMSFWYHMYGDDIETLKLYMVVKQSWSILWSLSADQSDQWFQAQVPVISGASSFYVTFEGLRGKGYKGDIAIDDISFTDIQGSCPLKPTAAVPFGCNFESNFCSWKAQSGFSRQSGKNVMAGLGPSVDRSTSSNVGSYAYFRSSFYTTSTLTSSTVRYAGYNKRYCLYFFYHIYGPSVSTLNVYVNKPSSARSLFLTRTGNSADTWRFADIQLEPADDFQVTFETIGNGTQGSVAIDDIDLEPGDCYYKSECTFEGPGLCLGVNDQSNTINWAKVPATTSYIGTGPRYDHTYNTQIGHYLVFDPSTGQPGSRGRLITNTFYASFKACVSFFYHMFGSDVGTLNVFSGSSLVFTRTGSQNDTWNKAQFPVTTYYASFVFEGIRGNGPKGVIAIDDFRVRSGSCSTGGSCGFEDGDLCLWTNSKYDKLDWLVGRQVSGQPPNGPSVDHTIGTAAGRYLYLASGFGIKINDSATIESSIFPSMSKNGICFNFWYMMVGSNIGTLNIYLRSIDSSTATILSSTLLWTLSGQRGRSWASAQIPINLDTRYQLTIEGIINTETISGFLAVDDLDILPSATCKFVPQEATPPSLLTTTASPATTPPVGPTVGNDGLNCNFEKGICLWTHDDAATFKWDLMKGGTASDGTGPKFDHTFGNGTGTYVYIETSLPRKMGDKARLISPPLKTFTLSQGLCLSFWLHMYGPDIYQLNLIYLNSKNASTLLWRREGQQGDIWLNQLIQLPVAVSGQRIVFEGVSGKSYQGDIALDDISFIDGNCPPPDLCTFEYENAGSFICGWTQDNLDDFDWDRINMATPSSLTGPSTDHTLGTNLGYYLYIETSSPRRAGDKARLFSPNMPPTTGRCFEFWYHMYGDTIGGLKVSMVQGEKGMPITLLDQRGNRGNKWHKSMATLKSTIEYKVLIDGTVGTSYTGDIAIDDLSFTDGSCPPPGSCDFENGFCRYENDASEDDFEWLRTTGSTSSFGTGPKFDHTKNNDMGYYVYIEASYPRVKGERARLISEKFDGSYRDSCLKFYYHMYGDKMGTLNIYIKTGPGNKSESLVWTLSGNFGDVWLMGQTPLRSTLPYWIVIEGVVGGSYTSDISLDDILLESTTCQTVPTVAIPPTPPPTIPPPVRINCTFDTDICSWKQSTTDDFDWTFHSGSTPSVDTGPKTDHTNGSGGYVYIEASWPRKNNDRAVLISPTYRSSKSTACFSFWYHMFGADIGTLTIYYSSFFFPIRLWVRRGPQGPRWRYGQVKVNSFSSFSILIEGTRGMDYNGDIAIDDVALTDGDCPHSPTCDFESDECGWSKQPFSRFGWTRGNNGSVALGTGPKTDVTTESETGQFLYFFATAATPAGTTSNFMSPLYPKTTIPLCFSFYYHLSGNNSGSISLQINGTVLWNVSGHQSNWWYPSKVTIPIQSSPYKISIVGTLGQSVSNTTMAIDELSWKNNACPEKGTCDFEDGDYCTWLNVENKGSAAGFDDMDWDILSGETPSYLTGPLTDHTLGTPAGYYIYLETSGAYKDHKARLISEKFPPTRGRCMELWLHMYGSDIGAINILQEIKFGKETLLFNLNGTQGNRWIPAEVNVASAVPFKMIIEGVVGTGYQGDIAVDDISFRDGQCVGLCSSVPPTSRVNCGFYGIPAQTCLSRGCCYDNSNPLLPACFYHPSTCMSVPHAARRDCGAATKDQCLKKGCCYDNAVAGVPSCYLTPATPTDIPTTVSPSVLFPPTPYDCDFESGFCLWNQRVDDQFNWTRYKGQTPSDSTGPRVDHTLGTVDGYYIYIETSFERANSSAVIESPTVVFPTGDNFVCMMMWYHMFGIHVSNLSVYKVEPASTKRSLVWRRQGTYGHKWREALISIPRVPAFKVQIEALKGSGYMGDIAIDDIKFINGSCPDRPTCDFEGNHTCGYIDDASADFTWLPTSASTSSWYTGPPFDHSTQSVEGMYLYTEASYPRRPGDKARVMSPENLPTMGSCVVFFYHMYGTGMGALNVYISQFGRLSPMLWQQYGDHGDRWFKATLTIKSEIPWRLVFEGVIGSDYTSDIAIDDITIKDGECPYPGSCDFEDNMCDYTNSPKNDVDWMVDNAGTPSLGTGPSVDHTLGTVDGQYIFVETSYVRNGGKALIESERFVLGPVYTWCLGFWYHMYGRGVGTLKVYSKYFRTYNGLTYTYNNTIWKEEGDQMDEWRYANITLTGYYSFQVGFEVTVSSVESYLGDIALDDIVVKPDRCPSPPPPPTINPCALRCKNGNCISSDKICDAFNDCPNNDQTDEANCGACDFEKGLCGYTEVSKGEFKWIRNNNGTPSAFTGPTVDHTLGTPLGNYMYVEADNGGFYDFATLQSPQILRVMAPCALQFWFHMKGFGIGTLRVYLLVGTRNMLIWERSGDQGKDWLQATVYLGKRAYPFNVRFEAQRSYSTSGDIAIDDILFANCSLPKGDKLAPCWYNEFKCQGTDICVPQNNWCDLTDDCGNNVDEIYCPRQFYPQPCTFEYGPCSFTPMPNNRMNWTIGRGPLGPYGIGPMFDHTTGLTSGSYLYLNTRNTIKNQKGRVISGLYRNNIGNRCTIRFHYHMFGKYVGTFNVKLRNYLDGPERLVWSLTGNQGNIWNRKVILIYDSLPFQIIFEGISSGLYDNFVIAIDDISSEGCMDMYGPIPTAPPTAAPPTTPSMCPAGQWYCLSNQTCIPSTSLCDFNNDCANGEDEANCGGNCNFENNDCGYMDASSGQYKWLSSSNPDAATDSTPRIGYDGNNNTKGTFKYVTHGDSIQYNYARLSSAELNSTADSCVVSLQVSAPNTSFYTYYTVRSVSNSSITTLLHGYMTRADALRGWNRVVVNVGSRRRGWRLDVSSSVLGFGVDNINFLGCGLAPIRTCTKSEFKCRRGSCIDPDRMCDFADDCGDMSDENSFSCFFYGPRCNFEQNMCDWTQDKDDDIDWIRQSGGTPSYETGPGRDHTLGTQNGYFLYIETSYGKENDSARISSVTFKPPSTDSTCKFRFFYHMYGQDIASLNIYLRNSWLGAPILLWTKNGSQGDFWYRANILINSTTTWQIVIEAKRGPGYRGDIAIDDLSFTPGCPPSVYSTLSPEEITVSPPAGCAAGNYRCKDGSCVPGPARCDFKVHCSDGSDEVACPSFCSFENNTCFWYNGNDDRYDWVRYQPRSVSPIAKTLPVTDHTLNNSAGYYLAFNSTVRSYGQVSKAIIRSPLYRAAHKTCHFSMWYNKDIASDITIVYLRNQKETVLLDIQSSTNGMWVYADVPLPKCSKDFAIMLEAVPYTPRAVAVVDDIAFLNCSEPNQPASCASNEIRCAQSGLCIPSNVKCDLEWDCCDGSDEVSSLCQNFRRYTFETGVVDWDQLENDDFDWELITGGTVSEGTGPPADHTTMQAFGKYLYIETSSPRKMNDTARIGSPVLKALLLNRVPLQGCRMRFFYHMLGSAIGSLNVYVRYSYNESGRLVFSLTGSQGRYWLRADVELTESKDHQVVIEGVTGAGFQGDIAIDDISFTEICQFGGSIPGMPPVVVNPCKDAFWCAVDKVCISNDFVCDFTRHCSDGSDESSSICANPCGFENGICGFKQDPNDDFDWTRITGSTPSSFTGPTGDATGSLNGSFMYIEASNRRRGEKSILISPQYGHSAATCTFNFYYHMYGYGIGTLEVWFNDDHFNMSLLIVSGDQGIFWKKAAVTIGRHSHPFRITIIGIIGTGYSGDIAVDEISFTGCEIPTTCPSPAGKFGCDNGGCVSKGSVCDFVDDCGDSSDENEGLCSNYHGCNFDHDFCEWTLLASGVFNWTRNSGSTSSVGTGPTRDHTTSDKDGYYVYLEASFQTTGDKALMSSAPFLANGPCTMRMFYHMFGRHVKDLNVYVAGIDFSNQVLVWNVSGEAGDQWLKATIDLSSFKNPFVVIIEGIVGNGYMGDTALDDITFSPECLPYNREKPVFPTRAPVCGPGYFTCLSDRRCIELSRVCDRERDCDDESDERTCQQPTTESQVNGKGGSSGRSAGISIGVILAIIVLVVGSIILMRKRQGKNLQMFSISFDSNNTNPAPRNGDSGAASAKTDTFFNNPCYDMSGSALEVRESSVPAQEQLYNEEAFTMPVFSSGKTATLQNPVYSD